MKANHSGTFAEQTRARANWKQPSEIERGQVERCANCRLSYFPDGGKSMHCTMLGYATNSRAWCGHYQMRGAFAQKGE